MLDFQHTIQHARARKEDFLENYECVPMKSCGNLRNTCFNNQQLCILYLWFHKMMSDYECKQRLFLKYLLPADLCNGEILCFL
jgi:hypothetical protein